jgi:REP element-mobilizing transposase RayT
MAEQPHSRSLRTGRFSEPGRIYLVTSRLAQHRTDFADWRTGRLLVDELRAVEESGMADSLAWVVMPDHFHWLVARGTGSLCQTVQRVKSKTAIAVNKRAGLQGSLWQSGYHDTAVRHEEALLRFARYIIANPLRAGLVRRVGDYPLWDAVWLAHPE